MAFPLSSVDFSIKEGREIPIEKKSGRSSGSSGMRIAPLDVEQKSCF
jgi:methylthioribose-1-phosphate isomerase